jgi:hypothetical protein
LLNFLEVEIFVWLDKAWITVDMSSRYRVENQPNHFDTSEGIRWYSIELF